MKGDQILYLNHDPNVEYADSNAWKAVLSSYPKMLDETRYPRNLVNATLVTRSAVVCCAEETRNENVKINENL